MFFWIPSLMNERGFMVRVPNSRYAAYSEAGHLTTPTAYLMSPAFSSPMDRFSVPLTHSYQFPPMLTGL